MPRKVISAWDWASRVKEIFEIAGWATSTILGSGAVTAILASISPDKVPWHLVIFYTTGVMAFVALILTQVANFIRDNAIHRHIILKTSLHRIRRLACIV